MVLSVKTEIMKALSFSALPASCITRALALFSSEPTVSPVFLLLLKCLQSPLNAYSLVAFDITCPVQLQLCFGFLNCTSVCLDGVSVFLKGYLSLLPASVFSLLCVCVFEFCQKNRRSLFNNTDLLPLFLDFLLTGMELSF